MSVQFAVFLTKQWLYYYTNVGVLSIDYLYWSLSVSVHQELSKRLTKHANQVNWYIRSLDTLGTNIV